MRRQVHSQTNWHANGIKAIEGNFTGDAAEGIWTWWSEQGEVERQENLTDPWQDLEDLNSLEDPVSIDSLDGSELLRIEGFDSDR